MKSAATPPCPRPTGIACEVEPCWCRAETAATRLWWRLVGRPVDPTRQQVFKFFPRQHPERYEIVLVDDVRCRVTRCKVRWDGPRWTILSLRVKEAS